MARTVLAGIILLGLLACGSSKKPTPAARNTGATARPATQAPSRTTKAQPQRRTTTTTRDTTKRVNPLTGH